MLEYLLIRPYDSPLFDDGRSAHWQFIVLDEAHQYRGARGMEMGMLIRRLKQRLRSGGRRDPFQCIATSATITSSKDDKYKSVVAEFAKELFGEPFSPSDIIFGETQDETDHGTPRRYHAFFRALEGAFLIHQDGADAVVLNRKQGEGNDGVPLEIALCRECGQHYYVGSVGSGDQGKLHEAIRDPSHPHFGVEYYLPMGDTDRQRTDDDGNRRLCRSCGALSESRPDCGCGSEIPVVKCESHKDHPDQLKQCKACNYRGGGDPVQEIVHGSDGPNTVIATALHGLLPEQRRKVLAFADSRQEAAFFAWYAEHSYEKLRDCNLMLRAITSEPVASEGLSIDDLRSRLLKEWDKAGLFSKSDTSESKNSKVLTSILREAMTDKRRLSLAGVGLVRWFVTLPQGMPVPDIMRCSPWSFTEDEAHILIGYLLDEMRLHRAMSLPEGAGTPPWQDLQLWSQQAFANAPPGRRHHVRQWGGAQSAIVRHFLPRLLEKSNPSEDDKRKESRKLMVDIWRALQDVDDPILQPAKNGTFHLDSRWLRVGPASPTEIWECDTCATISNYNIRNVCPRNQCLGKLGPVDAERLKANHYRILYENPELPPALCTEEHTAQIAPKEARKRQQRFKQGDIHLLSSSTTFEVGVDLGDLDSVFLRNVPPEPFNYAQRAGRSGRRDTPGLVLTYCRRNPHDLYHYEEPVERLLNGKIYPPHLRMTNEKIIRRHMVAVALSGLFKQDSDRFKKVEALVGDWETPQATDALYNFCKGNKQLKKAMLTIVPENMHDQVHLGGDTWIDDIAGKDSRLALAEKEVCTDYTAMEKLLKEKIKLERFGDAGRIKRREKTIASEPTLNFLSRKAVIPKYGFPVDVVELDVRSTDKKPTITLQRDLSQAIAEYAPGGKVVANKLEWESCGIKKVIGKEWPVRHYHYDDARSFKQRNESDTAGETDESKYRNKYLIPQFGFVTELFKKPEEPKGRARRLYPTRPFFPGFDEPPESRNLCGVQVTQAVPGVLVILCEGRKREGFYICRECGRQMAERKGRHKSPEGSDCGGTLENFSLGHELHTDIVRLQFPEVYDEWETYSLAYAVLLGAAKALGVPDTDLNVTVTYGDPSKREGSAIVLYDNVPGGAGLVAQLESEEIFANMLRAARERVQGNCGCGSSCYGCLRSYRNQFAHDQLDCLQALGILNQIEES